MTGHLLYKSRKNLKKAANFSSMQNFQWWSGIARNTGFSRSAADGLPGTRIEI